MANEVTLAIEAANTPDAVWCLQNYFDELAERFEEGFDPSVGSLLEFSGMTPPKGWFLMARRGGDPVGCGVLTRFDDRTGEIKRVWVSDTVRGAGVASRLMDRLEEMAAKQGFKRIVLDTNRSLSEAQAMYAKRGYEEIRPYNKNPYADHWFEKGI